MICGSGERVIKHAFFSPFLSFLTIYHCPGVTAEMEYLCTRLGRTERKRRVRGMEVEGFRGKCGHQLLAAVPGRRLLDGNPAADV